MRVIIEKYTLQNSRWYPIFDAIILLIEENRHAFSQDTLYSILESSWIESRPAADRDLIRLAAIKRSHDSLADKSSITIDEGCRRGGRLDITAFNTFVHPLDVIAFLSLPFQVVVENEWYDGSFLLWMARALGFQRLITAYRERRFQFRHAGGKNSLARSAEILSRGVWPRQDDTYLHARRQWVCVVMDSDARFPGDDPNEPLRTQIEPHVAFLKQLRRRSIESYLPKAVMNKVDPAPAFRRRIDALFRLSEEQRSHYHMKKGFRFGPTLTPGKADYLASSEVSNGEKSLFRDVADGDWLHLCEGFGSKLADVYVDEGSRPAWNDRALSNASDRAEMLSILEEIYKRM